MIYLTADKLLHVAHRATGGPVEVRDHGLLESAAGRPGTTALGADAYPDPVTKAGALLHSLARHHALVDGNKRLVLAGLIAFLGLNGYRLTLSNDQAHDLTIAVAAEQLDGVAAIAQRLRPARTTW